MRRRRLEAAYAELGLDPAVEIEGFAAMTAAELSDELVYLGDYQG